MGVQDLRKVSSGVEIDGLGAPETFIGMRGKTIPCRSGEIVVGDDKGIIASFFQGPDERTVVRPDSRALLFYVFSPYTERANIMRAI